MSTWTDLAISKIEADFQRSADTHLIKLDLPGARNTSLYLKDESTHPTGSLKHRLARSLFLYGLCNGHIHEHTTIVEASSGNTAISEAYFAKLLELPFVAVVPRKTSPKKVEEIARYDGRCHFVEPDQIYTEAARLARELNGHYMDQFTNAERATDWRGNNNIAESIFQQMELEPEPIPTWIVASAGTGGTSATIGRYIRLQRQPTNLCVADPENSVFHEFHQTRDPSLRTKQCSRIEGIGRPRVEPSFLPTVIDRMIKVPDAATIATIHFLHEKLGRRCGGSTGTNLFAAFQIISELNSSGEDASIVSLICDSGERYLDSYYDPSWLQQEGIDISPYLPRLQKFHETGFLNP